MSNAVIKGLFYRFFNKKFEQTTFLNFIASLSSTAKLDSLLYY